MKLVLSEILSPDFAYFSYPATLNAADAGGREANESRRRGTKNAESVAWVRAERGRGQRRQPQASVLK